jgi:hypothetical protein
MLANMVSAKMAENSGHGKVFTTWQNGALVPGRDRRNSPSTVRFAGRPTSEGCFG